MDRFYHYANVAADVAIYSYLGFMIWLVEMQDGFKALAAFLLVVVLIFKILGEFHNARRARRLDQQVRHIEEMAEAAEQHHHSIPQ